MKKLISVFMTLLIFLPLNTSAFSDIKETDYYLNAAEMLEKLDVLSGYPDGTFKAEKTLTRAEMATIVCRMLEKEKESQDLKGKTEFNDVKADHWASGYINLASKEGIINGYGNGKFCPENDVMHEEAIKMVVCAMGYKDEVAVDNKEWSKGYLEFADNKGISDELKGRKGEASTRGDIAVMAFNAMASAIENSKIPAMPVASKEAGEYTGTQKVKLTSETKGAVIYYTKDGTMPTQKSNKYRIDISITQTCTLKAVAVKDGIVSKVLSIDYTIKKISGGGGGGGGGSSSQPKPTVFKVTFDLNYEGAVNPASQTVEKDKYAVEPEVSEREGFFFVGWYVDNAYTGMFDFGVPVTKDYTLFARWLDIRPPQDNDENNDEVEDKKEEPDKDEEDDEKEENTETDPTKDTDGDGLLDIVEEYYGTDKTKSDSDSDGLTDFFEIEISKTNPLIKDTDSNGINDSDEDFDNDGLSNLSEQENKSNPYSNDSDADGLNDYDEINTHNTKPDLYDTDEDGLCDGDEIKFGLNPFLQKTNGTALDLTRTFLQTLNTQNIAPVLLSEENSAIPDLSMNALGNIDSRVRILTSDAEALKTNTAVLGMPIFINIPSDLMFSDAIISFAIGEYLINQYLICEYSSEGFIPLPTTYSDGVISAKIERQGTYFVLDTGIFLANLGINPLNCFYPETSEYPADIVFIIDKTNSMWDLIDNLFDSLNSFSEDLSDKRINARFLIVEYQDITKDGFGSTILHKNLNSDWWDRDSIEDFKTEIFNMRPDGGGDLPETPIDGLYMARNLVATSDANKFFILITDAPYKENNQYGVKNMDEMTELLLEDGINVSIITKDWEYPTEQEYDLVGWYLLGDEYGIIKRVDVYHDKSTDEYFYYTFKYDYETDTEQPVKNYVEKESVGFDVRVGNIAVDDGYEIIICDVYYDFEANNYYYIKKDYEKSGYEFFRETEITDVSEIIFNSDSKGKVSGYKNLYEKTGGVFGNINYNFSNTLKSIVTMIEESIADSLDVVLDNYETLTLEKPLSHPDPSDTDKDGIYDIDELIDFKNAHLKEYLKVYLNANGQTYENYVELGGKQYITVWSYKSRPDKSDTDGDGISDLEDQNPKIWDVSAEHLLLLKNEDSDFINLNGWRTAESFYSPLSTLKATAYIKDNNMVISTKGEDDASKLNLQIPQIKIFIKNIIKRYYGRYDNFYVIGNDNFVSMISEELQKAGVSVKKAQSDSLCFFAIILCR